MCHAYAVYCIGYKIYAKYLNIVCEHLSISRLDARLPSSKTFAVFMGNQIIRRIFHCINMRVI